MKKQFILFVVVITLAASTLTGCKKKDRNTTVTVNEDTVVDETE